MLLIFIVMMTLSTLGVYAQSGDLSGKVINKNTQNPIKSVTVRILGTNLGAITKDDGTFKVSKVPVGTYQVQFTSIGFMTFVESNVIISQSKPISLEVELSEKVVELAGAEVRSSYFIKKIETVNSTQTLNAEDIRRAPGVQEDVIRATALLPGVAVTSAGRNDLLVRGGAPFENLFVVDNIEVPNINHFGSQGSSGGPLSIVNIDFVRNVSFSAGAFGAKYGDKVSSITNITLRNGNEEKFGGKATLSATGFGLNLEGPTFEGGSFLFSARRSYLDFIFTAAGFSFIPEYWDFHLKLNQKLDDYNQLSFLTIGALGSVKLNNDKLDDKYDNSRVTVPNQKQYFSGITWKHLFEKGYSTVTLGQTMTVYETFQNDSNLVRILQNNSTEAETSLRADLDYSFDKNFQMTIGNQVKWATTLDYDVIIAGMYRRDAMGNPHELRIDTNFSVFKNATYINLTGILGKLTLNVGGRLDYANYIKNKLYGSPRASLIYQVNDISAITMSGGRYYQFPSYIWMLGNPDNYKLDPITADQVVVGYDHNPYEFLKVQVEGYYKWYSKYPARVWREQAVLSPSGFDDVSSDIPFALEPLNSDATGYTRGIELFIQKKLSELPLYGLLSISVGESKFKALDKKERYSSYDSRFIMNLALGYRFDNEWELSGKFRIATGVPTTEYLSTGSKDWVKYNEGERLPLFHALDMRLDKRWNFASNSLVTYIDIQNIYGRKNVSNVRWNYRTQSKEYSKSIGILPSIGVSYEF